MWLANSEKVKKLISLNVPEFYKDRLFVKTDIDTSVEWTEALDQPLKIHIDKPRIAQLFMLNSCKTCRQTK